MNWQDVIQQIEDGMFPQMNIDVWERTLYYHLLRHTHAVGKQTALIGLASLAQGCAMSDWKVREAIRSLDKKKCIRIEERSPKGHLLRVFLPSEIEAVKLPSEKPGPSRDIETIDFFRERQYLPALLKRQGGRCFYTLKEVTETSCVLDHVVPQADGGDNSYKNIVVSSHDANSLKQGSSAEDFVRGLYRRGILSVVEVEDRLKTIEALKAGEIKPEI